MAHHENGKLNHMDSHLKETLEAVVEWHNLGNKYIVDGSHLTIAQVSKPSRLIKSTFKLIV